MKKYYHDTRWVKGFSLDIYNWDDYEIGYEETNRYEFNNTKKLLISYYLR